jgi:di/tricarboxylate transporter
MTFEAWITLTVVAGCIALQVTERVGAAAGFLGAVVLLMLAGVLTPGEAFAGFSNAAPITVAALFVAARAVEKAGLLHRVTHAVLGSRDQGRLSLGKLVGSMASLSAWLNNTPLVAVAAPQVADWAHRRGVPPSRYLMPLSYATIFGGVATTIGTSTNLVVSGMLDADGRGPLGLFDMTPVGLPVALVGIGLLVWLAPVLLPERRTARAELVEEAREFVVAMRVVPGGPLDGVSAEDGGLRHLQGVFLYEVTRGKEVIAPVAPTVVFQSGDVLAFAGQIDMIVDLQRMPGLESTEAKHVAPEGQHVLVEAVVGWQSPLVRQTLRGAQFRERYQAAVLAIHRAGSRVRSKLGTVPLEAGDSLLLLTDPGFITRWRHRRDFLMVAQLDAPAPARHTWRVAAIAAAILVPVALGLVPMLHAALAGAFAFVLARVLSPSEAIEAIDIDLFMMIAAAFGLGTAMEKTGLARELAVWLVWLCEDLGRFGPTIGVVLATVVITELVTNNAAAAIMYPIAAATATAAGTDVRAMAVAVAVMASCSFLTPIGYQTNMMVYGPGGYRFLDYTRLGLPLTVASVIIVVWLTAG